MSSRTTRFAVKSVATDVLLTLLWRFGWRHSSLVSLVNGGVLLVLTVLAVACFVWWDRHPEAERRMQDKNNARLERHAREVEAAEAAHRASGRR